MEKLCLYFLLILLSNPTLAAVGKITEQPNSPASIQRNKEVIVGTKGAGVEMNDTINTKQGKVGIVFVDDTKVQVNENSKLIIDDFVYDAKAKTGKLAMKMALGTVRYASGQISHNSNQNVNITTPTATIAVRGTDFTATVDEVGASTIILLPTCPPGRTPIDIDKECYTGIIDVITEAGMVTLTKPFEATKVTDSSLKPLKPVILNLSIDAINNMLIVSPPPEIDKREKETTVAARGALDQNFLKEESLTNALDEQNKQTFSNKLSRNLLDQNFLENILDIINAQLAAEMNLLNTTPSGLLPDYRASTGIIVAIDEPNITLCRDDGSNIQCVTTPTTQSSTIIQQQGSIEIKNRINSGGNTMITLRQN
jgi:hypothetical protein